MPPSHTLLDLEPQLSSSLAVSSNRSGRPYKIFVACNGRLIPPARPASNDMSINGASEGGKAQYEIRLLPGLNRIELEIVTDSEPPGSGLELERCNIFANLTK